MKRNMKNCHFILWDIRDCKMWKLIIWFFLQAFHSDIQKHQQPILALVYQTEQLLEHHQEELTPEQVTQLQQLAENLKSNMSKVGWKIFHNIKTSLYLPTNPYCLL